MFIEKEIMKCLPKGMELIEATMDFGNDCSSDPFIEMTLRAHLNELIPAKIECSTRTTHRLGVGDITNVIYNDPATIVFWKDGTKTVVKCQDGDTYSKETGLALCVAKKTLGNEGNFNNVFKKWCN